MLNPEPFLLPSIDVLSKYGAKRVLDLACGSGHLSERLAALGYNVMGADLNREMLDIARERVKGVSFAEQDARHLTISQTFDAVVVLGRSFTYMTTDADANAALKSIYGVLKKGGVLVFDNFDAEETLKDKRHHYVQEVDAGEMKIRRVSDSVVEHDEYVRFRWNARYEITEHGKTRVARDSSLLRSFFSSELERLLTQNGFSLVESGKDGHALLMVAQKE